MSSIVWRACSSSRCRIAFARFSSGALERRVGARRVAGECLSRFVDSTHPDGEASAPELDVGSAPRHRGLVGQLAQQGQGLSAPTEAEEEGVGAREREI